MREHLDFLEHRFASPTEEGVIEGIAVTFNVLDTYGTTFDSRAFSAMAGRKVPLLHSHRQDVILGSCSDFTFSDSAMMTVARLNLEVQSAREARALLLSGDIDGFSIGFETVKDERRAGGVRHITSAILHEISLVALPSVPGARVTSVRFGRSSATVDFLKAVRSAHRALSQGN